MVVLSKKGNRKGRGWVSAAVFLVAFLFVWLRLTDQIGLDQPSDHRFRIIRVLDGDTVELTGGDRLRLAGIDTPEKGEPFYQEATRLLERLTVGQTGRIEFGPSRRDKYGRLLGYLYIDSLYINKVLIENGLGNMYLFRDSPVQSDHIRLLLQAQRDAIDNRIGIWSLSKPAEERYIARSGYFRFHRPGCRSADNLTEGSYRTYQTRIDAAYDGLSPCRNCKP